ncbi:MAG: CopG family antitoxin [Chloroflexota bacterium]
MSDDRSSISQSDSYGAMGEFWDTHDLNDYWASTSPADFEVDIQSEVTYFALDNTLSEKIARIARHRGISPDTLLNLWVQERLHEELS